MDAITAPRSPVMVEMVGKHDAFICGQFPERKPSLFRRDRRGQADRQAKLDSEFQVDVEELGTQCDHAQMWCQMSDIESPQNRSFDLGTAFAQDFGRIGMLPEVVDISRKATLSGQQGRSMCDRPPAVQRMFGIEGDVHTDVFTSICISGMSSPRRRNHHRGTCGDSGSQGLVDTHVGCVARTEIIARQNDEAILRCVAEPFGESATSHGVTLQAFHMPIFAVRASVERRRKVRENDVLGGISSVVAKP